MDHSFCPLAHPRDMWQTCYLQTIVYIPMREHRATATVCPVDVLHSFLRPYCPLLLLFGYILGDTWRDVYSNCLLQGKINLCRVAHKSMTC